MRSRPRTMLPALVAVLMLLGSFPLSVAAQPRSADPYEVLEASSNAMSNVQAARFNGSVDMHMASGGSSMTMTMGMDGEYRAPDRMHMSLDLGSLFGAFGDPSMSGPMEMVMVGDNVWMRMGSQPWESMSDSMGTSMSRSRSMSPTSFSSQFGNLGRYIPNAMLVERGDVYEVRGDLDLNAAMSDGMEMAALMGMDMPTAAMTPSSARMLENMTARFSATINRSSMLMEGIQLNMTIPEPGGPGEMHMVVDMNFSDFNSPTIQIQEPM